MKILFVCNANVGRSQAAEALFKRLSSLDAHSAGTRADEIVARSNPPTRTLKDSPSPAVPYLKELGVDISQNLRTQLTSEMVQQADKVIVMVYCLLAALANKADAGKKSRRNKSKA